MKRPKRGAGRALARIELGAGVVLVVEPPRDAFAQAEIMSAVESDMDAMLAGEPTARPWEFGDDRVAALALDEHLRLMIKSWMRSVVMAERCVVEVEGLEEEDGAPCAPSFDLFAALFENEARELRFRAQMIGQTKAWESEGNASGRAPNGPSTEGSSSVPVAEAQTPRAPEASASQTQTESESAAPSTSTPPALPPARLPGASPTAPAPGAPPA